MKLRNKLVTALVTVAMLLTVLPGGLVCAAADSAEQVTVFEPLTSTEPIAFERHAEGYAVSLDRDGCGVSMSLDTVPSDEADRTEEKAELCVRTGVTLSPGRIYRVSYTLEAAREQPTYTVCFDGTGENAYGAPTRRSVTAGGADRACFYLRPEAADGELTLRLLLGRTGAAGNRFRLSALAVAEASEAEAASGSDPILVSALDYHTGSGMIRTWTHEDCAVRMRSDSDHATLTVTGAPSEGAEVWKIKLLVATGLNPTPGMAYRFRAELSSTAEADYEICYNEDETEKGYDVLYGQKLRVGTQTVERILYVPADRAEPGQLIVQFSLGLLPVGESVTLGKVTLEEIEPTFTDVLPADFAFNKTREVDDRTYGTRTVAGSEPLALDALRWGENAVVTKSGDRVGDLTVSGGSAALEITGGENPWDARFNIDTGAILAADTVYRASFRLETDCAYSDYEIKFGTVFLNDFDILEDYGALKGQTLAAGEAKTVNYQFRSGSEASGLLIQLFVGATEGRENTIRVSGLEIRKMAEGDGTAEPVTVRYPSGGTADDGSFELRDGKGALRGDGSSATFVHDEEATGEYWQRGLFINSVCVLSAGVEYRISFDVASDRDTPFEVAYNKDGNWGESEKGFGAEYGLTASAGESTVSHVVKPTADGALSIRLDLGKAEPGAAVTIRNLRVEKTGNRADYPDTEADTSGSFELRDGKGTLRGDGSSATFVHDEEVTGEYWQRGLFINGVCGLSAGVEYRISFDITADRDTPFEVAYNKDGNWGESEKGFGAEYGLTATQTESTVSHVVTPEADGALSIRLDLGKAEPGAAVTVRKLRVERTDGEDLVLPLTTVYPSVQELDPGSFELRDGLGTLRGDGSSATFVHDGEATGEYWQRGLFLNGLCTLNAGELYAISFDVAADRDTPFEVAYNKDGNWGEGHEKGFGAEYGLTAGTEERTVRHSVAPSESGELSLRLDLGKAESGAAVTVRNLRVEKIGFVESDEIITASSFGSVWGEQNGYTTTLTRSADRAEFSVTPGADVERTDWRAKLFINTGFVPEAGKSYSVSFDIVGTEAQEKYHVLYGYGGSGAHEKDYGELWNESLAAGRKRTVTQTVRGGGTGSLTVELLLGLIDGDSNSFTVSNVRIVENKTVRVQTGGSVRDEALVKLDMQSGYMAEAVTAADSAAVRIDEVSTEGAEFWKLKLFTETGLVCEAGKMYLVSMDVTADHDTAFEVCYNRDDIEKGFDAVYGLRAEAGETLSLTKTFVAGDTGSLVLQLSLGMAEAPDTVTLSKVRVQHIDFDGSGRSVLPAVLDYGGPGAVSFWAHEDYTASVSGSADAVTVKLHQTPAEGAEPWKVKLFLGTGVTLQAGRHYQVSAKVLAKTAQDFELCYNNGDAEMGYAAQGGLRMKAGETLTVKQLISVPADLTDAADLRLQFNLGAANAANTITVSDVRVEEAFLSFTDMLGGSFAYRVGPMYIQTAPQCYARLETVEDSATVRLTHTTEGTQAWMARLLVRTGATLVPGKTYRISAELQAAKAQSYELCLNNGYREKGYGAFYDLSLPAGSAARLERLVTVPADVTNAGELVLQFSVGAPEVNDVTVRGIAVQEVSVDLCRQVKTMPAALIDSDAAGALTVTRDAIALKLDGSERSLRIAGAALCATDLCTVSFTARADAAASGTLILKRTGSVEAVLTEELTLAAGTQSFTFPIPEPLAESGSYELLWKLRAEEDALVTLCEVRIGVPAGTLLAKPTSQTFVVNGRPVTPAAYSVNGYNYVKLRDLALLLNGTQAGFSVRYNQQAYSVRLTTGMDYIPNGGELAAAGEAVSCVRSAQRVTVNGVDTPLKAYSIGGYNYFRLRDLREALGFELSYDAATNTVYIRSGSAER